MIRVDGLRFTYPGNKTETLRGLSFRIEQGEVFGFLGPSGSGKSTTQKIIIGLMFISGVLFFEKRQGVIDALVVTPVRTADWLASKVLSLTVLATVVAVVLALLTTGPRADWLRLVPCFAIAATLFTLLGFSYRLFRRRAMAG